MISAMGKAHHTLSSTPVRERKYAAGTSTRSCLEIETNIESVPFLRAWKVEPITIQKPAKTKQ